MNRLSLILTLTLLLGLSSPAWPHPGWADKDGCHTTRKWERHCHGTVYLVKDDVLDDALARAGAKASAEHQAMEEARARAAKSTPRLPH